MDLTTLSDADLAAHLEAVLTERDRRAQLATIPATVAQLAVQYVTGGGDPGVLSDAVRQATAVPQCSTVSSLPNLMGLSSTSAQSHSR